MAKRIPHNFRSLMGVSKSCISTKGTLTVVGEEGKFVYVECSICNSDKELYPKPFKQDRGSFNKVDCSLPCFCLKRVSKLSIEQKKIIHRRMRPDDKFIAVSGCKKFLYHECGSHGKVVKVRFSSLWRGEGNGCLDCKYALIGSRNIKTLNEVLSNLKIPDDVKVSRVGRENGVMKFLWECNKCKGSLFYKHGLSNIFKISHGDLIRGTLPCWCSDYPKSSKVEREILARYGLYSSKAEYIDLQDKGNMKDSQVTFRCTKHSNQCTASLEKAIRYNVCADCEAEAREGRYLYKHRMDEKDHLYFILLTSEKESFVKVGRTFNIKQRFNCYKSRGFGLEVLKVEEGLHKHIVALELSLHRKYKKYHYTPLVKFGGSVQECYSLEILGEIKND